MVIQSFQNSYHLNQYTPVHKRVEQGLISFFKVNSPTWHSCHFRARTLFTHCKTHSFEISCALPGRAVFFYFRILTTFEKCFFDQIYVQNDLWEFKHHMIPLISMMDNWLKSDQILVTIALAVLEISDFVATSRATRPIQEHCNFMLRHSTRDEELH